MIRSPLPGDGPELHDAVNESLAELRPWMLWVEGHKTVESSEESVRRARIRFVERTELRMHFYLKGTGALVGSSGLQRIDWDVPRFEIGYWCRTRFAGHGYVTEAVRAIAGFASDELGANRVEIRCDPRNERSRRVAERAGFVLEGELRNAEVGTDGAPRNVLVYSVLPEERERLVGANA